MIDRGMLWAACLEDLGRRCSVDTTLDAEYVKGRIDTEGESFLTTTLPAFGKDFERALEDLAIAPDLFQGFKRRRRAVKVVTLVDDQDGPYYDVRLMNLHHGVPNFLRGFMLQVFSDSYDVAGSELASLQDAIGTENTLRHNSVVSDGVGVWASLDERIVPVVRPIIDDEEAMLRMADAINAIRQLCLMFGKEKGLCSDSATERAIAEFVRTDEELLDPFSTEG